MAGAPDPWSDVYLGFGFDSRPAKAKGPPRSVHNQNFARILWDLAPQSRRIWTESSRTDQADSRYVDGSLNPASGLLNAVLMEHQACGGTRFLQFEFQGGVDAMVGPARGRIRKDLLSGLIRNTDHQVPIAITNSENKARVQLIPTLQPVPKFRINGEIARRMVGHLL